MHRRVFEVFVNFQESLTSARLHLSRALCIEKPTLLVSAVPFWNKYITSDESGLTLLEPLVCSVAKIWRLASPPILLAIAPPLINDTMKAKWKNAMGADQAQLVQAHS